MPQVVVVADQEQLHASIGAGGDRWAEPLKLIPEETSCDHQSDQSPLALVWPWCQNFPSLPTVNSRRRAAAATDADGIAPRAEARCRRRRPQERRDGRYVVASAGVEWIDEVLDTRAVERSAFVAALIGTWMGTHMMHRTSPRINSSPGRT
ncbi:MAG TPA: hypothetical protein VF328_16860 [Mycobacterium sp.]|jgi:hypothetical protein